MQTDIAAEEKMALREMTSHIAWLESKGQAACECTGKEEKWLEKWARFFVCYAKEFGLF